MKLPNGTNAIVDDRKLREYVLNPTHPIGKHHAALFDRLLGSNLSNAGVLKQALLHAVRVEDVHKETRAEFGTKHEVRFDMMGPRGPKQVVSVWITNDGEESRRLVTCFVR